MSKHLFLEFLNEKVISKDKNYAKNKEYVAKKYGKDLTHQQIHGKIETGLAKYLKALKKHDEKLVDDTDTDLEHLEQLANQYHIDIETQEKDWQLHEKDVISGINNLFKSGFFVRQNGSDLVPIDSSKYKAELKGGSRLADVRVLNSHSNEFYVECKLNLANAQYFKFGVDISNDKLTYNHEFFLTKNQTSEQLQQIDDLFTDKININAFIEEVLNAQETKKHWKHVLTNIKDTLNFISDSDEFGEFAKQVNFNLKFPDCFVDIVKIFDTYCNFYISKYNKLIDELFNEILDDTMWETRDTYKIKERKHTDDVTKGTVFQNINSVLQDLVDSEDYYHEKMTNDEQKFIGIIDEIKVIEAKFFAMLKGTHLDPYNFSNVTQLGKINKLEYFFKMFLSSVGHKNKDKLNPFIDNVTDKLGNLQLCPEYIYVGSKLAQMITDYYVLKDKCAYIQIDDKVLQFKVDKNPLMIPDLPIYSECATRYVVKFAVSPKDLSIHLDIRLLELNASGMQNRKIVSFKENDDNYVQNVLDKVIVNQN